MITRRAAKCTHRACTRGALGCHVHAHLGCFGGVDADVVGVRVQVQILDVAHLGGKHGQEGGEAGAGE